MSRRLRRRRTIVLLGGKHAGVGHVNGGGDGKRAADAEAEEHESFERSSLALHGVRVVEGLVVLEALSALLLPRDSVRTLILYLRLGVLRSLAVRMDGGCEEIARPLYEAVYADGMPQKWRIARRQPVAPYQAPLHRSCYKSMQRTAPVCLCFRND